MTHNRVSWYAVRVRNQHEDIVARHLLSRELECFLPMYKEKRQWSDRIKEIDVPLFAGYVFCQFSLANRLLALTAPGVLHIVGIGKNPCPIDDDEMTALQTAVKSGLPTRPTPFLEVGHKVRLEHGPLSGVEGILLEIRSQQRIVLSINLLQRSVAVEVNRTWVRSLSGRTHSTDAGELSHAGSRQPVS